MIKKFIGVAFLTFTMLFLSYSYFALNYKILYLDPEYPMWLQVHNVINSKTNNTMELLVIGDSRAKAGFIPNEIQNLNNLNNLNLSVGGATPVEGYFTLLTYLHNNSNPKKIIFSYSPDHLSGGNTYWGRTVPFDFLTDNEYQEVEQVSHELNEAAIIDSHQEYGDYKFPNKYRSQFRNGIAQLRWVKNKLMLKECELSKGHHFFGISHGAVGLNDEAKSGVEEFNQSKLQDHYLNKLLQLTQENHIKAYFYIMPFNQSSFDKVSKIYLKGYENYILDLSSKYSMTLCNSTFAMKNEEFGDPSHLFKGAVKNTHKMEQCVL